MKTLKEEAIKNGFEKNAKEYKFRKIVQGVFTKYEIAGSVDGGYFGTLFFNKDGKFINKKLLTDPGYGK